MKKILIINMDYNLISDFVKRNAGFDKQYSFTFGIEQTKLIWCHERTDLIVIKSNLDGIAEEILSIFPEIKIEIDEN